MDYRKELVEICQIMHDWMELESSVWDGANINRYDLLNIRSKVSNRIELTRNKLILEKTKCEKNGCKSTDQ